MQSLPRFNFAKAEAVAARLAQARVPLALGLLSSAGLALAIAAVLPSLTSNNRAVAAVVQAPLPPIRYLGAAAAAQPAAAPADPAIRRFTGTVGPDLSSALAAAGVPAQQGREYVALLARAITLADGLSVDDRFDLVVERAPDGSLGQLVYAGLDRVARADVELLKWTDGKQVIWVNADGVGGDGSDGFAMPVAGRVTSRFGNRFHPILGYARFHDGIDLAAAAGTPIAAAADGRVVASGWAGGYGREVVIAHQGGLETTLRPHEPHRRQRGRDGPPRPGHRLCRLDRPVDRPASPFRGHEERPPGQPDERQAHRRPRPAPRRPACRLSE